MIKFIDKAGNKKALEFSKAFAEGYIHLTLWQDLKRTGSTTQIPRDLIPDIIDNLKELENGFKNHKED